MTGRFVTFINSKCVCLRVFYIGVKTAVQEK